MDTSHEQNGTHELHDMLGSWLRPGVGFNRPCDVLKDQDLSWYVKRSVSASWASDASGVADHPYLRWMIGTPAPVPLGEVEEALKRLGWSEAWLKPQSAPTTH